MTKISRYYLFITIQFYSYILNYLSLLLFGITDPINNKIALQKPIFVITLCLKRFAIRMGNMPRPASLFTIRADIKDYVDTLLSAKEIPDALRKFTFSLIQACLACDSREILRSHFIEYLKQRGLPTSDGVIHLRMQELMAAGSMFMEKAYRAGRAYQIYTLRDIHLLLNYFKEKRGKALITRRRTKETIVQEVETNIQQGMTYLSLEEERAPRIESLFCILDSSMKLSGRDKRSIIHCKYYFSRNDYIYIETTTSTEEGSSIAHLADERAMRALNAMLLECIEQTAGMTSTKPLSEASEFKLSDGYLFFDIYDLCRRMGLRPTTNNRVIARKMIERLKNTTFKVDASHSSYFRAHYLPDKNLNIGEYRYITEFFARKEHERMDDRDCFTYTERYYFVKFNSLILANLSMLGRSFISHPELAQDRSGLSHRLNNWSKAVIGVRPSNKPKNTHSYVLDEFRDRVMPSARLDNFERDFMNLAKTLSDTMSKKPVEEKKPEASDCWVEGGRNVVWLYGYYYAIEWDKDRVLELNRKRRRYNNRLTKDYPVITVWRDTEDIFVGDESNHNQALRRNIAQVVLAS